MTPDRRPGPPETEAELVDRARSLAGRDVRWLAEQVALPVPPDLTRHKGWLGQLVEILLGADGTTDDGPDFRGLGIELKTIPVDERAVPRESTWVCTASLDGSIASRWEESRVHKKLDCVLWVPILTIKGQPLAERQVAMPQLWRANVEEAMTLRGDWEELSALIREGRLDRLDARTGEALHLRPKAAHSRELVPALDQEGNWTETNPRGFYLRRSFTTKLIQRGLGWVSS
jgi:DNA mismatch repair protein MutH